MGNDNASPTFPIHTWNHHGSILADLSRTNNAQENYHLTLRRSFNGDHPPLSRYIQLLYIILYKLLLYFRLITVLKNEERIATDKIRQYELNPLQGVRVRERKKTYRVNDNAIKALVIAFDGIEEPTDDEILTHLRSIQYRLMRNDFDEWN